MKNSFRPLLWALPILYMAFIWVLSSLPTDTVIELPDSELDGFIKESLHLVEFAILYFLFVVALGFNGKLTLRTSLIVALISCMYGAIDEIHQSFYPYRSASWFDLLKDCIGVAAVWGHIRFHYFHRKKSVFNRIFPQ